MIKDESKGERDDTATELPRTLCAHELFEASADRTPLAPAVSFEGQTLDYRELERRSNRMAHHLRRRGAAPGVLVGLMVERSLEMVIAVIAIHKAGGAYVPLDPGYPRHRLDLMLEDSGATMLVTRGQFARQAPSYAGTVVDLDGATAEIERESAERPERLACPADLAYVIYTSGSTGRPKGVEIEHRSLVNFLRSMRRRPGLRADEVLLAVGSLSFDIANLDIYLPLAAGARVEIASRDVAADGERLAKKLSEVSATMMQATPSTWTLLLDAGWRGGPGFTALSGGEAMPVNLAARLLERCGALWNLYGPTETTVWATAHRITDLTLPILVGRPIDGAHLYVLGEDQEAVPAGVVGDLYIGGEGVARGYRGRPDLTRERFLTDPFRQGAEEGARMYDTGDRARLSADGQLEILGRLDHQVKIRGHRVELDEIAAVLAAHPRVRQAVVVLEGHDAQQQRLIAYYTTPPLGERGQLDALDLRAFLRERLPVFMIPAVYAPIDRMPLTPSGKIDRSALPSPEAVPAVAARFGAPPRDAVEEKIWRLWMRLLGVRSIGVQDDFFDVGGHSMLGARLIAELNEMFSRDLPLVTLFEARTIEALAALFRQDGDARRWPTLARIRPGRGGRALFFSARPNVNALGYAALARHLDPERPIYMLQVQYPEEPALGRPYTRDELASWATVYLDAMRALEPEGPYLFGGMCEGALIGFEMVKQLEAMGERVGLFAILDTWPQENTRSPLLSRVAHVEERVKSFLKLSPTEQARTVVGKFERLVRGADATVEAREAKARWRERAFPTQEVVPEKVRSRITVFRSRQQPYWRIRDPELGWGARTTGGVDVHLIEGLHPLFMREPHVRVLGGALDRALRAAGGA